MWISLKDEIVKLIEKSKLLNFDEKPNYWYSFFTVFFRIIDCFFDKTNKQKLCDRSFFQYTVRIRLCVFSKTLVSVIKKWPIIKLLSHNEKTNCLLSEISRNSVRPFFTKYNCISNVIFWNVCTKYLFFFFDKIL